MLGTFFHGWSLNAHTFNNSRHLKNCRCTLEFSLRLKCRLVNVAVHVLPVATWARHCTCMMVYTVTIPTWNYYVNPPTVQNWIKLIICHSISTITQNTRYPIQNCWSICTSIIIALTHFSAGSGRLVSATPTNSQGDEYKISMSDSPYTGQVAVTTLLSNPNWFYNCESQK